MKLVLGWYTVHAVSIKCQKKKKDKKSLISQIDER